MIPQLNPLFDVFTGKKPLFYEVQGLQNSLSELIPAQQFSNFNNGIVGQHDFILKSAKAQNGGVLGFASNILFGEDVPDFPDSIAEVVFGKSQTGPKSVSEGLFGGSLGSELGKSIQPLVIPVILLGGFYILSKRIKW
mgnify:CR=1 FL=1|jgi:hypothetical protein